MPLGPVVGGTSRGSKRGTKSHPLKGPQTDSTQAPTGLRAHPGDHDLIRGAAVSRDRMNRKEGWVSMVGGYMEGLGLGREERRLANRVGQGRGLQDTGTHRMHPDANCSHRGLCLLCSRCTPAPPPIVPPLRRLQVGTTRTPHLMSPERLINVGRIRE